MNALETLRSLFPALTEAEILDQYPDLLAEVRKSIKKRSKQIWWNVARSTIVAGKVLHGISYAHSIRMMQEQFQEQGIGLDKEAVARDWKKFSQTEECADMRDYYRKMKAKRV